MLNRLIGHNIQSCQSGNCPIGQSGKCSNRAIVTSTQSLNRSLAATFQSGTLELLQPIGLIGHNLSSSAATSLLPRRFTTFSACRSSLVRGFVCLWVGSIVGLLSPNVVCSRCLRAALHASARTAAHCNPSSCCHNCTQCATSIAMFFFDCWTHDTRTSMISGKMSTTSSNVPTRRVINMPVSTTMSQPQIPTSGGTDPCPKS